MDDDECTTTSVLDTTESCGLTTALRGGSGGYCAAWRADLGAHEELYTVGMFTGLASTAVKGSFLGRPTDVRVLLITGIERLNFC